MENKDIEMNIADSLMERPHGFSVGGRRFSLYPVTLGKTCLLSRLMESLGLNAEITKVNPYMEALRLCREKRDTVCRLLSYHTVGGRDELFDGVTVEERSGYLDKNLTEEELAQLLVVALTIWDNTEEYIKHFGIDKDREEMAEISKIKDKNGNTVTFGGKSVFGFIDWFCERYGWTFDYVVWGISYGNLLMLRADAVTSVYLTDEERKKAGITAGRTILNADDPANAERIMTMFKQN